MKWLVLLLTSDKYFLVGFIPKIQSGGNLHISMGQLLSMPGDNVLRLISLCGVQASLLCLWHCSCPSVWRLVPASILFSSSKASREASRANSC